MLPINLINAFFFAAGTGDYLGARGFVVHFTAFLDCHCPGRRVRFRRIVTVRGIVSLVVGSTVRSDGGLIPPVRLRRGFVVVCVSSPAVLRNPSAALSNPDAIGWLPYLLVPWAF